jgi:hypothetical protein
MYLRGNIGIDAAELTLFWLGIGSIACAFLYQAVEIGVHIWSIAQRREHPIDAKVFNSTFQMFAWAVFGSILTPPFQVMAKGSRKSHISSQSAENENAVVVPLSATTFRDVVLYEHKILDQRHLVLHVTILGATDLKSVDCRRYVGVRIHLFRTWCYVKKICRCHVIHLRVVQAEIEPCVL